MTRETVCGETPATLATSAMTAPRRLPLLPPDVATLCSMTHAAPNHQDEMSERSHIRLVGRASFRFGRNHRDCRHYQKTARLPVTDVGPKLDRAHVSANISRVQNGGRRGDRRVESEERLSDARAPDDRCGSSGEGCRPRRGAGALVAAAHAGALRRRLLRRVPAVR